MARITFVCKCRIEIQSTVTDSRIYVDDILVAVVERCGQIKKAGLK